MIPHPFLNSAAICPWNYVCWRDNLIGSQRTVARGLTSQEPGNDTWCIPPPGQQPDLFSLSNQRQQSGTWEWHMRNNDWSFCQMLLLDTIWQIFARQGESAWMFEGFGGISTFFLTDFWPPVFLFIYLSNLSGCSTITRRLFGIYLCRHIIDSN